MHIHQGTRQKKVKEQILFAILFCVGFLACFIAVGVYAAHNETHSCYEPAAGGTECTNLPPNTYDCAKIPKNSSIYVRPKDDTVTNRCYRATNTNTSFAAFISLEKTKGFDSFVAAPTTNQVYARSVTLRVSVALSAAPGVPGVLGHHQHRHGHVARVLPKQPPAQ